MAAAALLWAGLGELEVLRSVPFTFLMAVLPSIPFILSFPRGIVLRSPFLTHSPCHVLQHPPALRG